MPITSPYAVPAPNAPTTNGTAPVPYPAMESLPVVVPWPIVGSAEPMRVVYRLDRVADFVGRVYREFMAPFVAEEARIKAEGDALQAQTPPPADLTEQLETLEELVDANTAAAYLAVLQHTVVRVIMPPEAPTFSDPTNADAWAAVHPAVRAWLAQQAITEVRSQLTAPFQRR